ncbi:DUF3052 domain-containing protein [Microbispora sp. H10830]|uniref:DUF3052 domain-containing protein n=1 Tax=Microbispora sp. H10830 TaxID=2729109 RepID=UPI0016034DDE|nr:DUF3052 domain-containing protein [Microbispora sp. H10830]
MIGYSRAPLPRKLGVKPGHRVLLVNAPQNLPIDGHDKDDGSPEPYDVIVMFCPDEAALRSGFPQARERLARDGGLWVGWPKKSSGVATDLSGDVVRAFGLGEGLVDNKVCAVDEVWSGLRFVYRLADR